MLKKKNGTKEKKSNGLKRTRKGGGATSRTRTTPRATLIKKLDAIFSQFIRLRAVDENGYGNCFTCGQTRHYTEVDAGHFMSRACMSTRWSPRNVQFQCKRCNGFRSGEQYLFSKNLDRVYGKGTAEELLIESKKSYKWTSDEIQQMIRRYKQKVDDIKSTKGI